MARTKNTSTNTSASNTEKRKVGRPRKVESDVKIIDKSTEDNGFSVKREKMQSVSFSKMQEILQRNINRNLNLTFTHYSKEMIKQYLNSPANNVDNIRAVSRFLCRYSILYQKIIMYLASMPLFHYNITPVNSFNEDIEVEEQTKKYYKVLSEFNKFNIKKELYNVLFSAIRDGIYIGYMFDKDDGAEKRFLMMLEPQYVRVLGKNASGEWVVYFNAAYFDSASNKEFVLGPDGYLRADTWPQIFVDGYKKYKDDGRDYQWFRLPPEKTLVLLIGPEDEFAYPLPFLAPLFTSLLDLLDLEQIVQDKTELENIKMVVSKIPLLDDNTVDDFAISIEMADFFNNLLQTAVPEVVSCVTSPMDITVENFEGSNTTADTDELAKAIGNLFNNAGFSQVVVTGGGASPSTLAIKYSQINDSCITWVWVNRLETWFNYYIAEKIAKGYIFEILRMTPYNQEDYINTKKEAATLGGSALDYTSAVDGSPFKVINKLRFENALGIKDLMVPLSTSYTQSGDEERGRPLTPDDELTDSGQRTRDQ